MSSDKALRKEFQERKDQNEKIFPLSARVSNIGSMGTAILIYLAISIFSGALWGIVSVVPLLGPLLSLMVQMINLYCLAGIVTAVLFYRNLIG